MFTELKNAFDEANRAKRRALARGKTNSPAARQPWIYSFALRGNTFLMKGHSLDFFDFYRLADNAIVYETSNRGPRIWGWDSYLCDVQRVVGERMKLAQGIYIKPHRGAPVQRMLSAVSRGDTMLYWYTYGPDYKKGDSFSQSNESLVLTSKAAHLLGKAEDALYGSKWALPAEVAVVKPETTQRWMNLSGNPPHLTAAWENAKWVYSALQHAHIPVDPIDEQILATEDLSRYKIIYVSGSHIAQAAAKGLERYVKAGGTVYTSGWGLSRAVTLANWAFRVGSIRQDPSGRRSPVVVHVPAKDVEITIRAAGDVRRVESCMLDRSLAFSHSGDAIAVSLPRLEEGDVLLLK